MNLYFPVLTEQERKIYDLVRSGYRLSKARLKVLGYQTFKGEMPVFYPYLLLSIVKEGNGLSLAILKSGVSEGVVYKWAKFNKQLRDVLIYSRSRREKRSLISFAADRKHI